MNGTTEVAEAVYGKEQVVNNVPKVIKQLQFGVLSDQDIVNQSAVELVDRRLFDLDKTAPPGTTRAIADYGPLDRRMGISGKMFACETCGKHLQECHGHFGHVRLCLPVFHVGYFKKVIQLLQSICKACGTNNRI
jgi:DNA-directed RNA polymerase III subunit RPC1